MMGKLSSPVLRGEGHGDVCPLTRQAEAGGATPSSTVPPTPYSVRSAPASGRGSCPALGVMKVDWPPEASSSVRGSRENCH